MSLTFVLVLFIFNVQEGILISLHLVISMKLGYSLAITTDFSTAFHMFYINFSTPHYAYFSTSHPDP